MRIQHLPTEGRSVIINFKQPREKNKLKSTNYLSVFNVALLLVISIASALLSAPWSWVLGILL